MRRISLLLFVVFLGVFSFVNAQESTLKAFPTAEGFGKFATGGRGGKVVEVTTLEDYNDHVGSGALEDTIPGSFRWALRQHLGEPLTVVFRVSGVINLRGQLRCKRNNLTIAGQTAPGEGICFANGVLNFGGSENIIVRHIRSRIGDVDVHGEFIEDNAFIINNGRNIIIDHCSFGWSAEENMNMYDNFFQTIQWCIVHEGLYNAGHKKGTRGYGTQWGGSQSTYHHNLLAHNENRSPRFNGAVSNDIQVFLDFINNVNYNWGTRTAAYGGGGEKGRYTIHELNLVNNYYKPGPATQANSYFVNYFVRDNYVNINGEKGYPDVPSKWYIDGNIMEGYPEVTADNWKGFTSKYNYYPQDELKVDTFIIPDDSARLERFWTYYSKYAYNDFEKADEAFESVVALNTGAGAWPHDAVDRRILHEVETGTATGKGTNPTYIENNVEKNNKYYNVTVGMIDEPAGAGGYPEYPEAEAPTDSDGDGIPDEWEKEYGLDPNDPEDGNHVNSIGYTALEVYLNELVGEVIEDRDFSEPVDAIEYESVSTRLILVNSIVEEDLVIEGVDNLGVGSIYNMNGVRMMNIDSNRSNIIKVGHLSGGHYILVVSTNDGEVKTARFIKK